MNILFIVFLISMGKMAVNDNGFSPIMLMMFLMIVFTIYYVSRMLRSTF